MAEKHERGRSAGNIASRSVTTRERLRDIVCVALWLLALPLLLVLWIGYFFVLGWQDSNNPKSKDEDPYPYRRHTW